MTHTHRLFATWLVAFCLTPASLLCGQNAKLVAAAPLSGADQQDGNIAEWIERLGGTITRDATREGQPIIGVEIDYHIAFGNPHQLLYDTNFSRLAELRELESLKLGESTRFTDQALIHLRHLDKLKSLDLGSTGIDGSGLQHLANHPNLQHIGLRFCRKLEEQNLRHLAALPKLESLYLDAISGNSQSDDSWVFLLRMPTSRADGSSELDLYRSGVTDSSMPMIAALKLNRLSLVRTRITDEGLAHFDQHSQLTELHLDYTAATSQGMKTVGRLQKLRSLSLDFTGVTDDGLGEIAELANLESLTLRGLPITNDGVKHLSSLKEIRKLDLYATLISDDSVNVLGGLSRLEEMDLQRTAISFSGLQQLTSSLPNVSLEQAMAWRGFASENGLRLSLSRQNLTDEDLPMLAQFPATLRLELSGNPITDAGLANIANLKQLRSLSLGETQITDEGLKALAPLTELQYLNTEGTQVSFSGLRELFVDIQKRPVMDAVRAAGLFDRRRPSETGDQRQWQIDATGAGLTDDDLSALSGVRDIVSLKVARNELTERGIDSLSNHGGLEVLWMGGPGVTGQAIESIARLTNLKILWVTDSPVHDQDLTALVELPNLQVLNLCGCPISDDSVDHLSQLKGLQTLLIDVGALSAPAVNRLRTHLPELEVIRSQQSALRAIRGRERHELFLPQGSARRDVSVNVYTNAAKHQLVRRFGDEYFELAERMTNPGFAFIDRWKELESLTDLTLVNCDVPEGTVAHLRELQNLKTLSLYRASIADREMAELSGVKGLTSLDLQRSSIGDDGLAVLGRLPGLRSLRLGGHGTSITDLSCLKGLPNLEELSLNRTSIDDNDFAEIKTLPRLKRLSAREIAVSSGGVASLSGMAHLETVDLSHTSIDDKSIEVFENLPSLKQLTIDSTDVTAAAIERFRASNPNVLVSARDR